jgi:hypothetical protein
LLIEQVLPKRFSVKVNFAAEFVSGVRSIRRPTKKSVVRRNMSAANPRRFLYTRGNVVQTELIDISISPTKTLDGMQRPNRTFRDHPHRCR